MRRSSRHLPQCRDNAGHTHALCALGDKPLSNRHAVRVCRRPCDRRRAARPLRHDDYPHFAPLCAAAMTSIARADDTRCGDGSSLSRMRRAVTNSARTGATARSHNAQICPGAGFFPPPVRFHRRTASSIAHCG